ncbi:hypothetical protein [Streptomyces olivoreticuli]|uniref:hypothetical protein n=1 Tax=Streptomyces olivoreticuli TaxID=68246 RepID=UPI0013C2C69F|nr:hypothetical protein [Streptomyces olivoreticuli]
MDYLMLRSRRIWKAKVVAASAFGLVATSALPAFAAGNEDRVLRAEGAGERIYTSASDIPADGLKYNIVLPYYQENNAYAENAGKVVDLSTVGVERTLTVSDAKTTSQTITDGGPAQFSLDIGTLLNFGIKSLKQFGVGGLPKDPGGRAGSTGNMLYNTDTVTNSTSQTFTQTDSMKLTPRKPMTAEPVFFKAKTVSDVWSKDPASGKLKLERANVVSDVVVKQGWLLKCDGKVCKPGTDFTSPGQNDSDAEFKTASELPPVNAPDNPGNTYYDDSWIKFVGRGPKACKIERGGTIWHWAVPEEQVKITCPGAESLQNTKPFSKYRVHLTNTQGDSVRTDPGGALVATGNKDSNGHYRYVSPRARNLASVTPMPNGKQVDSRLAANDGFTVVPNQPTYISMVGMSHGNKKQHFYFDVYPVE